MPGRWIASASISPGSTRCSTSAIVIRPAIAATGLMLRADCRSTRLPCRSPFQTRTRAKSVLSACSSTKVWFSPFQVILRVSFGGDAFAIDPSGAYRNGTPPFGDLGANPGRREERRHAGPTSPHLLSEAALWRELDLELTGEELTLELLVPAQVGGDHPSDLLVLQQNPNPQSPQTPNPPTASDEPSTIPTTAWAALVTTLSMTLLPGWSREGLLPCRAKGASAPRARHAWWCAGGPDDRCPRRWTSEAPA